MIKLNHKNSRPILAFKYAINDTVRAVAEFDAPGYERVWRITKVYSAPKLPSGYYVTFVDRAEPLYVKNSQIVGHAWVSHWEKD